MFAFRKECAFNLDFYKMFTNCSMLIHFRHFKIMHTLKRFSVLFESCSQMAFYLFKCYNGIVANLTLSAILNKIMLMIDKTALIHFMCKMRFIFSNRVFPRFENI